MNTPVAIITGASSGIGEACVRVFMAAGYRVTLAARSADKLSALQNELAIKFGQENICIVIADVSIEKDCRLIVDETIKQFGRIDVLMNNAGISMRALFADVDLMVLKRLMDVNFWGAVYCTRFALPHILESRGTIVGVSSIAGKIGLPGRTGYSASKFALEGFLESVRIENMNRGVHVMVICPGFTASQIRNQALDKSGNSQEETPLEESRLMQPEIVADYILKGVKNRTRDIILTQEGKMSVWMKKFFPSLLDKLVFKTFAGEKNSPLK